MTIYIVQRREPDPDSYEYELPQIMEGTGYFTNRADADERVAALNGDTIADYHNWCAIRRARHLQAVRTYNLYRRAIRFLEAANISTSALPRVHEPQDLQTFEFDPNSSYPPYWTSRPFVARPRYEVVELQEAT